MKGHILVVAMFATVIIAGLVFAPGCQTEKKSPIPSVKPELAGKSILMVIAPDRFRDEELFTPREYFLSRGAKVEVASSASGEVRGMLGRTYRPEKKLSRVNVDDYDAVSAMVEEALKTMGKIDILVNNAAVFAYRKFAETGPADWSAEVNVDFLGVVNCCRAVIPHMTDRKSGKIINMASDAGKVGEYGMSLYSGVKAGVIGFSKAIAKELGRYGITVNCVSPGFTKTEKMAAQLDPETEKKMLKSYPLGRLGHPQDQANAVLFFASHLSDYITGQALSVSGGYSMT